MKSFKAVDHGHINGTNIVTLSKSLVSMRRQWTSLGFYSLVLYNLKYIFNYSCSAISWSKYQYLNHQSRYLFNTQTIEPVHKLCLTSFKGHKSLISIHNIAKHHFKSSLIYYPETFNWSIFVLDSFIIMRFKKKRFWIPIFLQENITNNKRSNLELDFHSVV